MRSFRTRTARARALEIVALATIALASGASAPGASAGTFEYRPCETNLHNGFWEREYPPYDVTVDCVNRVIRAAAVGSSYSAEPWVIARYPGPIGRDHTLGISEATVNLDGLLSSDTGRQMGVRFCSSSRCGPILPENPQDGDLAPAGWTFTRSSGQIPPLAQRTEIVGRCVLELGCDTPVNFSVSDISLVFEDTSAPVMDWTDPHFYPDELDHGQWVSGSRRVRFTTSDKGSGIAYARLRLNPSGHEWDSYAPCSLLDVSYHTRFCPVNDSGTDYLPDPKASPGLMPQGDTTLELWSVDMSGNASNKEVIPFQVDVTPPSAPANLRLVDSVSNWTNQPVADIAWDPIVDPYGQIAQTKFDYDGVYEGVRTGDPRLLTGIPLDSGSTRRIDVYARDRAGNEGARASITIGRDEYVFAPPALVAPAFVGLSHLTDPAAIEWSPPLDAASAKSGLCGYALSVDDDPAGAPPVTANLAAAATGSPAPGNMLDGEHFVHLRAVSCSGQAGQVAHRAVVYDLTLPRAQHVVPAAGWINEGEAVKITGSDGQTEVRAIHYSVDGEPEQSVEGDTAELYLSDGMHEVEYQSEDSAGNRSHGKTVFVGVDGSAPIAWIEPADLQHPTLMRAFATDDRAGLESARFVYRPLGSGAGWTHFGEAATPHPGARRALTMSAAFPDLQLPDGAYEVGVEVVDVVGRTAIATITTTGAPAVVTLPLRSSPRLEFGIGARGRKVASGYVRFGRRTPVAGRLLSPGGSPLAGVKIRLSERKAWTASRSAVAEIETGDDGRFRFTLAPGVWRNVFAEFAGSETLRPVEQAVEIKTRTKAILRIRPRRVTAGAPISFTMRVALGGAPINSVGRIADIQWRRPGGEWLGFVDKGSFNVVRDERDPRFATHRYRQAAPEFRERRVLEFRLSVPRQDRWQYVKGWSNPVSVTIVPRGRR